MCPIDTLGPDLLYLDWNAFQVSPLWWCLCNRRCKAIVTECNQQKPQIKFKFGLTNLIEKKFISSEPIVKTRNNIRQNYRIT